MYWIVSTDLGQHSRIMEFVKILNKLKQQVIQVSLDNALDPEWFPEIPTNEHAFFYGHVNFVARFNKKGYIPSVLGADIFDLDNIIKHVPSQYLLNSPENISTGCAKDILDIIRHKNNDEMFFFKPGTDQKLFAGSAYSVSDIKRICENIKDGKIPDSTPEFPLVMGELYGIESEYRCFVINHKVVASSQYAKNHEYFVSPLIPEKILEFAQKMINIWSPVDGYVLDIGLSNGNPYVVEYQGMNSAGFYDCNLKSLVQAMIEKWS